MCVGSDNGTVLVSAKIEKSNNQSEITSLTLTEFYHLRIMKRFLCNTALFVALVCTQFLQPATTVASADGGNWPIEHCCFIADQPGGMQGVEPVQPQLSVNSCEIDSRTLFNGFFEVVKSSPKVFFATFSRNKATPSGFTIKFPKVDISFPFNVFW